MNYIDELQKFGFLRKFIDIYFYRMSNLGANMDIAFNFIKSEIERNNQKDTYTNIFDVIEQFKKLQK